MNEISNCRKEICLNLKAETLKDSYNEVSFENMMALVIKI